MTQQTISPSALGARALIIVFLTVIFTALCVNESFKNGRLASSPNYDDVVYFQDGALLVHAFKTEGLAGFESFLQERRLHSPYSVCLAAASFAVFGFQYSSPYIASGLLVLTYLICIGWFLRRLPIIAWSAGLALFLAPPFMTMGVVEFRPDIAWAVATGFGVVFIVTSGEIFRHPGRAAIAGLFLGLSLLIKPSTFVMTTLLYTGAIFSRVVSALWEKRWRSNPRQLLVGATVFLATILVIAGPYWLRFGQGAVSYFMENSFGANKEVWSYRGTLSQFLLFYVTGEGAGSNVAIAGQILTLLALACLVLIALKKPELRWKLFMLLCLLAGAFVVNTAAQMKSPFLGGGIYGVWLFSSAYLIGTAYTLIQQQSTDGRGRWRTVVLCLVAVISLFFYRWPEYSNWGTNRPRIDNYRLANDFIQALLDQHASAPPKSILFTQAGPIVMEAAGLWFPTHGLKTPVNSGAFIRNEEDFREIYPGQEWIVVQEQGVMGASDNMPSEQLLPKFLEIIRADPAYTSIGEYTAKDGKKVWVYARAPRL